jgi:histidine triad (HIT) family protein
MVQSETAMESCLFCRIAKKELPSKIAYEDDRVFAFHDIKPQAPVHVLICPRKHIATLNDVSEEDASVLTHIFATARKLAQQFGIAEAGYRTIFNVNSDGGQMVFHLHLHLIGGRKLEGM